MKIHTAMIATILLLFGPGHSTQAKQLNVVTTLPDYAFLVRTIGSERVSVQAIVCGDQDAHFIRPKPSFATALRRADVFVATGLDLELWAQTVIDHSGNPRIRSGQQGYVAASTGMHLLEKPTSFSRAEGGVHIYGNPHVTNSPIQIKVAARNIATGLIKNDPENRAVYEKNLTALLNDIDEHLFGRELVRIIGGDTLCRLAEEDKLMAFLREQTYQDKPLIDFLGGWMKRMLPLRGTAIVTYHKNWVYFLTLYGLKEDGTVEPKPGIPPSPKHVTGLIDLMKQQQIKIILAANYFDRQRVQTVAARTGAEAVIVPLYVTGAPGTDDIFQLMDLWIDCLLQAAQKTGLIGSPDSERSS